MLSVRDIMVADPVVVEPGSSLHDAARLMHDRGISSLVVCSNGRVEGILTSHDMLLRAANAVCAGPASVEEFMTPAPTVVEASDTFELALDTMTRQRVRHLPVVDGRQLVGILSIRDLMHHQARFLEEVVRSQTAEIQARHAELQKRDRHMQLHLELAGRIQQEFLPTRVPAVDPFSLAVAYHPLQHVSGDTYDFTVLSGNRLGMLIADARGHGVPAAFVTVMARMVFQAVGQEDRSPAHVLRIINDRLPSLIQAEHFITMCYAVVDPKNLRMTWACAGHPPPLWHRHVTSDVKRLDARGDLIGVHDEPSFEEHTIQLRHHDTVLLYTDGLIEARNHSSELFGTDRVAAVLREQHESSGPDLVAALESELRGFAGGFDDDVTFIALQIG